MTGVVRDYDNATRQTMANEMEDYFCKNIGFHPTFRVTRQS